MPPRSRCVVGAVNRGLTVVAISGEHAYVHSDGRGREWIIRLRCPEGHEFNSASHKWALGIYCPECHGQINLSALRAYRLFAADARKEGHDQIFPATYPLL